MQTKSDILNGQRIAKNTFFLYFRMFFTLVISLYTSRVILRTLGVVDYGIFNVVGGLVGLFGTLNTSLSASMQRFYNYHIGKGEEQGVVNVYKAGKFIHWTFIAIVAVLLEPLGIWYVNHVLVLPPERLFATHILLQGTIMSLLIVILQIPYTSLLLAYEKMDFYAVCSVIMVLLKLLLVVCLPLIPFDKIIVFTCINIFLVLTEFGMYCVFCRRNLSFVFVHKSTIQKSLLREILSFSGWNVLGTFAYVLKYEGINIFLNFFFGPIVNAARGVAYQVQNAIGNFAGSITTAFRPQIVNAYAAHNQDYAVSLFFIETKVLYLVMLMLIVPLMFEINSILHLWLGDVVPETTNLFTILVLADVLVTVINQPCNQLVFATGNISTYQIASSIISLLLLPIAWLGLRFGSSAAFVFVLLIGFSIINQMVCIYIANQRVEFGIWQYITKIVIRYAVCILVNIAVMYALTSLFSPSYWRLLIVCVGSIIVNVLLGLGVVFDGTERKGLLRMIQKIVLPRKSL